MPKEIYTEAEFKRVNYEIFIWLLSLLSIFNIFLVILLKDPIVTTVVIQVNRLISLVFLGDFLFRLHQAAPMRRDYFLKQYGWLDLLSSVPVFWAQVARLVRLVRTGRFLSASGEKRILRQVFSNRANTAVLSIGFFVILLIEFGSIAILDAEAGAVNANIDTAGEAIWWVLVTISTVGYGDYFPVTANGRFIAVLVIIAGVAVFGTLSGFLAKLFLGQNQPSPEDHQALQTILGNLERLEQEQAEIKQLHLAEKNVLQARLMAMEQLLKQIATEQKS